MALGLVLLPAVAAAANSPAVPVPEDRWGSPHKMQPIKILHDSTHYDGQAIPTSGTPIFFDTDVGGDYLFSVTGKGLMVHDLSGNLTNPPLAGYSYGFGVVPTWLQSDLKFYFYDVSAPDTDPDVAVTAGTGMGLIVWDFSNRTNPNVYYQDYDNSHGGPDGNGFSGSGSTVYATELGGKSYAFTAGGLKGVGVWNLDNAKKYSRCDYSKGSCKDVWMGTIPVSGFVARAVAGTGNFLAVGLAGDGVEIWNVANPAAPARVLMSDPGGQVIEVGMWRSGAQYYLATLNSAPVGGEYKVSLWDVSCIASGSCSGNTLSTPVARLDTGPDYLSELTVSQSQGRTFLYAGHLDRFASGDQREFLWDVTDPETMSTSVAGPQELFPDNSPGKGYAGWYYARNPTGFENFAPMAAVVRDGYVFRAAWTVLDSHQILGVGPPVADFDWSPQPVYPGQATTFADQSTGAPSSWIWTFSGASPSKSQSFSQNPQVIFGTQGSATVTLSASNSAGASSPIQKLVQVLDPTPAVGSVTPSPASALVCQKVNFTANNVTGRPTLHYSWEVKDGTGATVFGPTAPAAGANPLTWDTADSDPGTPGDQPFAEGLYTAKVTVTNDTTPTTKTSGTVSLSQPLLLAIDSGPSATVSFGTVQFSSQTSGAASWTWDYGDGTSETFFTKAEGESPVHDYSAIGSYVATLTVDNCLYPATSATVPVTVTQIDPLKITKFEAQCLFCVGYSGTAGQALTFAQVIGGSPNLYEYDWDGNGTFEQSSATPVTTHTYQTPGSYTPVMRITRGSEPPLVVQHACSSETVLNTCPSPVNIGSAQPASISIAGPSSGNTGQSLTFTASASNCTAAANGWTWTATGLNVTETGKSITVSFSAAGAKSITAKNSACGNVTGTRNVTIVPPGGGGGGAGGGGGGDGVTASFNWTPSQPKVGQAVTFDASASTGTINNYFWQIDGAAAGTGKTLSHTFTAPGGYAVTLVVSGPGDCEGQVGGSSGVCNDSRTRNVSVGAGAAVTASFDDDADCGGGQVGGGFCTVGTSEEIAFTDTSTGPVSQRSWDFGDGSTATGKNASHAWSAPGTYLVTLTVVGEENSSMVTKSYIVTGDPVAQVQPVVVPWIAQADPDKALNQTSDLDVHNPGDEPIKVRITFRKRGLPEPDPPQVERTVPAESTLHVPDAIRDLFDRANISGFLFVEPIEAKTQPLVTTFNRTFAPDGKSYGQVVPGFPLSNLTESAEGGGEVFHLVGLNDNLARQSYFGISNPNDRSLQYSLRFYDSLGNLVGETQEPLGIARFGQKQFQVEEIRELFGVESVEDYRIEIEVVEGSPEPFIYGANLRLVSRDPSFLRVGRTDLDEVFLVGALNTPGLNDSFFQSDVVLGNTGTSDALCDLTYTPVGFQSVPTAPFTERVPAGESVRLTNVVSEWNVGNSVGVLRIVCDGAGGVFPVVQGEGYDVSRPDEVYGQFMPALSVDLAAVPGKPHSLIGLRQDEENRTTLWLFNPTDEVAIYDVRYFDLEGNELGGESDTRIGRGKFRQINPDFHPDGIDGGFVVRVEVKQGKLLTAAQVVNAANDPAYIVGQ